MVEIRLTEAEKLRISIGRVAQDLGFKSTDLPGKPADWSYELLAESAQIERGWNALVAAICERLYQMKVEHERFVKAVRELGASQRLDGEK